MKVLHVIFSFCIGGSENLLIDIINEQVKSNEVGLLVINDKYNASLLKEICPKVSLFLQGRKEGSKNPLDIIRFNLTVSRYRPDIIHFHDHNAIGMFKCLKHCPSVLTVHAVNFPPFYFKKYDKIFAISKAVQKDIRESSGLDSEVIYNGIHVDQITVKKEKNKGVFRMVQVSRLDHEKKGQHILLKALALLRDNYQITDFTLDFIGGGNSESCLKELVVKYGLESKVRFLGEKSREEIYGSLCQYDLLIQPSIFEGFGLTVTEAMAAKIPVLVSANDGPVEIIENGKYGFVFEKNDAESCCRQIKQIMETGNLDDLLNKSYLHVAKEFDIVNTANRYVESYGKLIN